MCCFNLLTVDELITTKGVLSGEKIQILSLQNNPSFVFHIITTKMHAALAIPEIVGHIVNQIEPTILCSFHTNSLPYFYRETDDLLAIAMISKSFSIHALNSLWSNMKSLVPLFSLLSSFDNKVCSMNYSTR